MAQHAALKYFMLFIVVDLLICSGCTRVRNNKLIIMAHRGASGLAPENTLAAFRKAMEIGADYSELDVRQSKDGQIVLLHDSTLERTTTGNGLVWQYTLAELKKLDAGSCFSAAYAGESIPTLEEVIRLVKGKMKLDIEIKFSGKETGIVQKVIDLVRLHGLTHDCILTSFDSATVNKIKRLEPGLTTGLIINKYKDDKAFLGDWNMIVAKDTLIDENFIKKAKAAGKPVHVYTVNDKEKMNKLIHLGVDGIITNYPNRLKEVVSEYLKREL